MKFKSLFSVIFFVLIGFFLSIIGYKKFFSIKLKPIKDILKQQVVKIKPDGTLYFVNKFLNNNGIYEKKIIYNKSEFIHFYSPYVQVKKCFTGCIFDKKDSITYNLYYDCIYGGKFKKLITSCNQYQRIFRFPFTDYLTRKYNFLKELKKAKKLYPGDYDFFIESYILPEDKEILKKNFKKSKYWIKKPYNLSRGRGVEVVDRINDFNKKTIVQKYIKPHLLFGKKYDIRIILLITSYDPLVVYLYSDGVLRFATHPYSEKEEFYIEDKYMHLTNNCVNKDSLFYKKNDDPNKLAESLASLKSFKKYCIENNINYDLIIEKVKDQILKCILMRYDKCVEELKEYKLKSSKNLFELIGVDIILDDNLEPHILEFNLSPSLEWNCKCGEFVHNNVLIDTFNLLGLKCYDRASVRNDYVLSVQERFQENIDELKRNRGGYELIFPLKDNIEKYNKFIKSCTLLNKLLWKYIEKNA